MAPQHKRFLKRFRKRRRSIRPLSAEKTMLWKKWQSSSGFLVNILKANELIQTPAAKGDSDVMLDRLYLDERSGLLPWQRAFVS